MDRAPCEKAAGAGSGNYRLYPLPPVGIHYGLADASVSAGGFLPVGQLRQGISLLLLIFAASYLLLLWQPLLAAFVPGAANVLISKLIDPILDQHMPKKEG